jgi:SAM-dependent methyltransferase
MGTHALRDEVAARYVRGLGIEVGALHVPLKLPRRATVRYVDFLPIETLREHHAHLEDEGYTLTAPDIVDNGERLESFAAASLDFVVANHFIEHTEDPIGTLRNHLRVLRPGGILFMVVPDKRGTFDQPRDLTQLEHLIRDNVEGPEWSRDEHYREWARHVDQKQGAEVEDHAQHLAASRFSIHFHVWTPSAYLAMLLYCQQLGMPFEIELIQGNGPEFITVLRKVRLDDEATTSESTAQARTGSV